MAKNSEEFGAHEMLVWRTLTTVYCRLHDFLITELFKQFVRTSNKRIPDFNVDFWLRLC